jgi:hypothetical protein
MRFIGASLFLALLLMPGFFLSVFVDGLQDMGSAAALIGFAATLLAFVSLYFLVRFLLLLPAAAIDEPFNLRMILERTRGNFWRLLAVCILSSLPLIFAYLLLINLFVAYDLPLFIAIMISAVILIFFAIVNVATLSIAYRELIGPPGSLAADMDRPDPI